MYQLVREKKIKHKVGSRYISERIILPGLDSNLDHVASYAHNLLALYNEEQEWTLVDNFNISVCVSTPPMSVVYDYLIKDLGYSIGFAKELIGQVSPFLHSSSWLNNP